MAFKMKNSALKRQADMAGCPRTAAKMKEAPMKMKKSPMEKELVGKQNNLPPELKAKIEAAPAKMRSRKGAVETESPMKATDAELMAADKAKLNKGARQQDGKGKTDKERSATPKLDRSKARRNDPDDGIVSASEASGGMFMKKSPMKKTYNQAWKDMSEAQQGKFANKQAFIDKAKADNKRMYGSTEPTNLAKEASKATGEKVTKKDLRKTDYSAAIRVDEANPKKSSAQLAKEKQAMQDEKDAGKFGDSKRAAASTKTGKDDRKYRKAEKARRQASEALAKGNTKRAERKLSKAMRKETKGDKARKA